MFFSPLASRRVFAATWNVAGKTPDMELNLNDLLPSDDQSDIFVLGYVTEANIIVFLNLSFIRWRTALDLDRNYHTRALRVREKQKNIFCSSPIQTS
jgi:hypothetical protein